MYFLCHRAHTLFFISSFLLPPFQSLSPTSVTWSSPGPSRFSCQALAVGSLFEWRTYSDKQRIAIISSIGATPQSHGASAKKVQFAQQEILNLLNPLGEVAFLITDYRHTGHRILLDRAAKVLSLMPAENSKNDFVWDLRKKVDAWRSPEFNAERTAKETREALEVLNSLSEIAVLIIKYQKTGDAIALNSAASKLSELHADYPSNSTFWKLRDNVEMLRSGKIDERADKAFHKHVAVAPLPDSRPVEIRGELSDLVKIPIHRTRAEIQGKTNISGASEPVQDPRTDRPAPTNSAQTSPWDLVKAAFDVLDALCLADLPDSVHYSVFFAWLHLHNSQRAVNDDERREFIEKAFDKIVDTMERAIPPIISDPNVGDILPSLRRAEGQLEQALALLGRREGPHFRIGGHASTTQSA
jgi:hypothetical protein